MKIYVTTHDHRFGVSVAAFKTIEGAWNEKIRIAEEHWHKEGLDEVIAERGDPIPTDPHVRAHIYFEWMAETLQFFEIRQVELEE